MHTLIIAEAGVNHNGDIEIAKNLVRCAANAGADIVKFQTFKAKKLVSKNAFLAEYQQNNLNDFSNSQFKLLKNLELDYSMHLSIIECCKENGIRFLSSPFDHESIDFLDSLNIEYFKIPSGEITNGPYLKHIAKLGKPIILSTGMANLSEINDALQIFFEHGYPKSKITLLHCNTEYPTPMKDVNLYAMLHIKNEFGVNVGYSDHTNGIEVPIAAVALGANVIEKHFTLDRNLPGPDHKASLEPDEFKLMVQSIRNIEKSISGTGFKNPSESEIKNLIVVRKSIVASCLIKKGELLTESNITIKRPGNGLSPMKWESIIGMKAIRDFDEDELIEI